MISRLLSLQVVDSLQGVGAIRCASLAEAKAPTQWEGAPPEARLQQLVVGTGSGRSGALVVLQHSVVPEPVTEVPLPGMKQPVCGLNFIQAILKSGEGRPF